MVHKVAIVGSVFSTNPEGAVEARKIVAKIINDLVAKYGTDLEIVSGGAEGVDTMAREIAEWNGIPVKEFLPESKQWMPHGYKERNMEIGDYCDELFRVYDANTRTWGSGFTARYTQSRGKSIQEFPVGVMIPRKRCRRCGKLYPNFHIAQAEISWEHGLDYQETRSEVEDYAEAKTA